MSGADRCPLMCSRQAAAQLLGPLRPDVTICAHKVRRTLADLFPGSAAAPGEET